MMCPPVCFFMTAVSCTADHLLSRSCAACSVLARKTFHVRESAGTRCSGTCQRCGVDRPNLSRGPFAGKSAFLERLPSATLTARFRSNPTPLLPRAPISARHGGASV